MKSFLVIALFLLPGVALANTPGIPDLSNSTAVCAYAGPGTPTLLILPDGTGTPFTSARLEDGTVVDATITVTLVDGFLSPVANYPFEDIVILSVDTGLAYCPGGVTADFNTNASGQTYFVYPLQAGGFSTAGARILLLGVYEIQTTIALNFNSPDMNGDLVVDLQDLNSFVDHFVGSYDFSADYLRDGVINLSDIGVMAAIYGAVCP